MTARVEVTSDLEKIAQGLERAAASAPALMATGRRTAARALIAGVSPVIVAHTPRISGKLAMSTTADVLEGSDTSVIIFRQPATSEKNRDSSGGGQHYVQWVVGGRGPIVASAYWERVGLPIGPYGTPGKKALRTPWGFRASVKAAPPNPYPERAMVEAAATVIPAALSMSGRQIGASIVSAIRGS